MIINRLHDFDLPLREAIRLQSELASSVCLIDRFGEIQLVAGVDVSLGRQGSIGRAAVVVIRYPSLEIVAESIHEGPVRMPYIPGLLSFRELPLILLALEKMSIEPDLFVVDGQGVAHPRRLGIASHLGLLTGKPVIGCAKSRLCGEHEEVGRCVGESCDLIDDGETIGRVIRTKLGCNPLYISTGHLINLETSVEWVLKLRNGYKLPEPVRLAHLAAGRKTIES